MQPLNSGLVNQNFADSSPAADVIDALDQSTDLRGDIRREIATFFSYFVGGGSGLAQRNASLSSP